MIYSKPIHECTVIAGTHSNYIHIYICAHIRKCESVSSFHDHGQVLLIRTFVVSFNVALGLVVKQEESM